MREWICPCPCCVSLWRHSVTPTACAWVTVCLHLRDSRTLCPCRCVACSCHSALAHQSVPTCHCVVCACLTLVAVHKRACVYACGDLCPCVTLGTCTACSPGCEGCDSTYMCLGVQMCGMLSACPCPRAAGRLGCACVTLCVRPSASLRAGVVCHLCV